MDQIKLGLSSQDKIYNILFLKKESKKYFSFSELIAKTPEYFSSVQKRMFLCRSHKAGLTIMSKLRKFFLHQWILSTN